VIDDPFPFRCQIIEVFAQPLSHQCTKIKMENKFRPLSKKEESIAREIGDAAY